MEKLKTPADTLDKRNSQIKQEKMLNQKALPDVRLKNGGLFAKYGSRDVS